MYNRLLGRFGSQKCNTIIFSGVTETVKLTYLFISLWILPIFVGYSNAKIIIIGTSITIIQFSFLKVTNFMGGASDKSKHFCVPRVF